MNNIGQFVKKQRKINDLTQAQLAIFANVSTKFISELENGKDTLELNKINSVLSVFNYRLEPVYFKDKINEEE